MEGIIFSELALVFVLVFCIVMLWFCHVRISKQKKQLDKLKKELNEQEKEQKKQKDETHNVESQLQEFFSYMTKEQLQEIQGKVKASLSDRIINGYLSAQVSQNLAISIQKWLDTNRRKENYVGSYRVFAEE